LNRLSFPALTQGLDKLTEGKQLAGMLSIIRHRDPEFLKSPLKREKDEHGFVYHRLVGKQCTCVMAEVGRRLLRAVEEWDLKFMSDVRKTSRKRQSNLRDVYLFLLKHPAEVERCLRKDPGARAELWRLLINNFPHLQPTDCPTFYRLLKDISRPAR